MRTKESSRDPFFAYVALGAVHGPHSPPNTYLDGTKVAGTYPSNHMDMLFEMDMAVGSLVDMIEEKGLANDTIIIFTSDNGGIKSDASSIHGHNSHGPFRGAKGDVYEGGNRVPMIFRYDGHFPAGETRNKLVGLQDLYATICELTDVDIPDRSARNSLSFAEYIRDGNATSPRKWQATWAFNDGKILSQSIRKGNLKLVRHISPKANTELYDLSEDISESVNIVFNATYKKMKKKMIKKLRLIGPCPKRERKRDFELEGGLLQGKMLNCTWFEVRKEECEHHPEGELFCPSVCGRYKKTCRF